MSRKRRRNPEPKIDKPKQSQQAIKFVPIVIAVILAGVPFVMGKYIEFNSPGPFDSASYVYSAKHILDGARLGVEEQSSAQPGTLLVNIIGVGLFGFNETGPKLMQGFFQAVAMVLMFYAIRKVYGSIAAVVSVTIASVCLSAPVIAKFGNVKEQYMIAFMIISVCCFILYQLSGKWWQGLLCGAFAINICFFKETGISVVMALAVYFVAQFIFRHITMRQFARDFALLMAGALIGLCPVVLFFLQQGQFTVLLNTFPVLTVKVCFGMAVVVLLLYYITGFCIRHHLWRQLKQVQPRIWIVGLTLIVILLISCTVFIVRHKDAVEGDFVSYLKTIPFIKLPLNLIVMVDKIIDGFQGRLAGYVGSSWKAYDISELTPKVMRYYGVLKVPVFLAIAAIILGCSRFVMRLVRRTKTEDTAEWLVLLFSVWWVLDMGFVWISPRSYEQYYLPLNASAAMLGGYVLWIYATRLKAASQKGGWILGGAIGGLLLAIMLSPIFFGFSISPDTGTQYVDQRRNPVKKRGFAQSLKGISYRRKGQIGSWEVAGDYIRNNSDENDNIYVWGWVPGIYVSAQRLSSSPKAFESDMHVMTPRALTYEVQGLLNAFKKDPPKFIVDSRKRHFPGKSPPLELWPKIPKDAKSEQFLPNDERMIAAHAQGYYKALKDKVSPEEAERFKSMEPFRKYIRENYKIVRMFGPHVLFVRSKPAVRN